VSNINVTIIHNVYDTHVTYNNESHVSYNGGNGGINARPTAQEEAAARERHIPPVAAQTQHAQAARANPQQRASANMGKPGVAATPRPGDFNDRGAAPAKAAGGPYTPANRGGNAPAASAAVHPHDLPPISRTTPNTGNPKLDRKYQQQQDKVFAKQQQERDKLQQQQDQEHVKLDKQKAPDAQRQQVEQKHQQQTQQLQQKHQQQTQELQQRQQPASREGGRK
jgi:hypothetical protein